MESTTVRIRIKSFHLNKKHTAFCNDLLNKTSRMQPSKVPAGQMNLQNHGSPSPVMSTINNGRRITKTARITNRKYRKNFSPGRFLIFLTKGILNSKS